MDFRKVRVYGGDGGDGVLSFLHLPHNEFAGPDGGNGGHGGHVIFQGSDKFVYYMIQVQKRRKF